MLFLPPKSKSFTSRFFGLERRKSPRKTVISTALVDVGGPKVACVIWNISDGGAKITIADSAQLPEEFTLFLSQHEPGGSHCRIVWRSAGEVGVKFLTKSASMEELIRPTEHTRSRPRASE
jgi:hypothetical protein